MRILVVGGAGYIGSVTVDQLLAADHDVTVFDSLVSGHAAAVTRAASSCGRRPRREALGRLFASHHFDAVVNYGGYIQAGSRWQQPGRYFANNVGGTITLLNAMVTYGVRASSSAPAPRSTASRSRCRSRRTRRSGPSTRTARSKAMVERCCPGTSKPCGLHYVALRYFNAAGATDTRARTTARRRTSSRSCLQAAAGPARAAYRSSAPTTRRPTAPASATTSTCRTWRRPTCWRWRRHGDRQRRLQPGQRPRLLQPRGHRGGPTRHRSGDRGQRGGAPPRRPAGARRLDGEGDGGAGLAAEDHDLDEIVASAWRWHQAHPKGYE